MIEIFKYLKGYVCIKVTGFSPERFMNLCSNREILLWNIHKEQDAYYMCLSIEGFFKLRPIVKKTGTKVAIVKRYGLPFLLTGMWKRKVFLLGFMLAAFFWIWTSGYIWAIEIKGNFIITEDVLLDYLNDNDVHIGMKKKELDIDTLEKDIRKEFDRIIWTSAKLEGTKLTVELKENEIMGTGNDDEENSVKSDTSSDLVAERDGKIVSIIVREGVPQVTAGTEVKKGDVLVAGSVPVYSEDGTVRKYNYCMADADIIIEYEVGITETVPLKYKKKSYTGREKKQYYLKLGDRQIQIKKENAPFLSYDFITKEKQLQLLSNLYLPIKFGNYTYREYYIVEQKFTSEEAKKIINDKYNKILKTLEEKGVQIIGKNVKIETNDTKWVLRGVLSVESKTGTSIPIEEINFPANETEQENKEQE